MTDCFALIGQPRRPWLDPEALKEQFHRLTAEHHPDVSSDPSVDFSTITAAYQLLRDPRSRLRHLFELEFPGQLADDKKVPPDLLDLFMEIAGALSGYAQLAKKLDASTSPLARALLAGEQVATLNRLKTLSEALGTQERSLLDQLRQIDATWPSGKDPLPLAGILQKLSFLLKWSDQIREAILRL